MPDLPRRARSTAALVTAIVALAVPILSTAAGAATPGVEVGEPAADAPAVADVDVPDQPVELDVAAASLRFVAGEGTPLQLADGRRFLDSLELTLAGDGQRLVNELTIDDYVAGVAEMPSRWHGEALKAQAVAARTYAWHLIELGTFDARGADICDTVDCQVFRGVAQEEDEFGDRWRAAVDATAGEVLVDDAGAPILARYFSTSGGRTLPNEVVFPSSGARPYLTGTDDPQDAISPFHRWEVTFTRQEWDTITAAGSTLAAVTPVVDVERLGEVDIPDVDLRFTGADGATAVLGSVEFRRFVSEVAASRFPDRFPGPRADGLGPLPATVPSSRFEVDVGDDEVVVTGRGWGHAVGMGQYGALGRATQGDPYDRILAAYYGGIGPTTPDDVPDRVRVALSRVEVGTVRGDGPFAIVADGAEVVAAATGTWELRRDGAGVRLLAPPGWGQAADVSRTELATQLPGGARAVALAAATATPGVGTLVVEDAGTGERIATRDLGALDPGTFEARWDLRDDDGQAVAVGDYRVALEVEAADGSSDGAPLSVRVVEPASDDPADVLDGEGGVPWRLVGLAALLLAGLLLVGRARRRPADRAPSRFDGGPSARDARPEPGGQEEP